MEGQPPAGEARPQEPEWDELVKASKPVVCAINGVAVGEGVTLTLPCDVRVASEAARFSFRFVRIGLTPEGEYLVNPVARTDPSSPIAGMPIMDVDKARTVVVIKRSLSPGFAGIPNPLFAADNVLMLFGDGKRVVLDLITAVKES